MQSVCHINNNNASGQGGGAMAQVARLGHEAVAAFVVARQGLGSVGYLIPIQTSYVSGALGTLTEAVGVRQQTNPKQPDLEDQVIYSALLSGMRVAFGDVPYSKEVALVLGMPSAVAYVTKSEWFQAIKAELNRAAKQAGMRLGMWIAAQTTKRLAAWMLSRLRQVPEDLIRSVFVNAERMVWDRVHRFRNLSESIAEQLEEGLDLLKRGQPIDYEDIGRMADAVISHTTDVSSLADPVPKFGLLIPRGGPRKRMGQIGSFRRTWIAWTVSGSMNPALASCLMVSPQSSGAQLMARAAGVALSSVIDYQMTTVIVVEMAVKLMPRSLADSGVSRKVAQEVGFYVGRLGGEIKRAQSSVLNSLGRDGYSTRTLNRVRRGAVQSVSLAVSAHLLQSTHPGLVALQAEEIEAVVGSVLHHFGLARGQSIERVTGTFERIGAHAIVAVSMTALDLVGADVAVTTLAAVILGSSCAMDNIVRSRPYRRYFLRPLRAAVYPRSAPSMGALSAVKSVANLGELVGLPGASEIGPLVRGVQALVIADTIRHWTGPVKEVVAYTIRWSGSVYKWHAVISVLAEYLGEPVSLGLYLAAQPRSYSNFAATAVGFGTLAITGSPLEAVAVAEVVGDALSDSGSRRMSHQVAARSLQRLAVNSGFRAVTGFVVEAILETPMRLAQSAYNVLTWLEG